MYQPPTMLTHEDTLSRPEKVREARRNKLADLESAQTDIHGAFKCLEEWMPEEAAELESIWERVNNRIAAVEAGCE